MTRVIVYHDSYGCDTGCCGHWVQVDDKKRFGLMDHPDGDDPREFAEALVRELFGDSHVADLDWENCEIVDDY